MTVIADLSTGSIQNIAHLRDHPRFEYRIDTRMSTPLADAADAVFHLAAAVAVKLIVENPVRTMETNVPCTELRLEIVDKKDRVFIASTSEVYGQSTELPFREDGDLVMGATSRGRWSYASSKAIDESLAVAYWREKRLPTVIGRCFNTVRARQTGRYGMVVLRFASQALAGEDITVYGDGSHQRCSAHVKDVSRAMTGLMDSDEAVGEVFNIGSQEEISILELAHRVKEKTKSTIRIVHVPFEMAYESEFEDMPRRAPSTYKIRRVTGWESRADLDRILGDVIRERTTSLAVVA